MNKGDIMNRKSVSALFGAGLAGVSSLPALSTGRLFVASFGSDTNNCFLATPCRTFQVAHNLVDPGGEVVALDAAGYAPLTITKSVTITANPGFYAGVAAATGNSVTIATASVNVV